MLGRRPRPNASHLAKFVYGPSTPEADNKLPTLPVWQHAILYAPGWKA